MNDIKKIEEIKKTIDSKFLRLEGINGSAIKMRGNKWYIVIYVKKINSTINQIIPKEVDGIEICAEEIGEVITL